MDRFERLPLARKILAPVRRLQRHRIQTDKLPTKTALRDPQNTANVILLLAAFYGIEWVRDTFRHNSVLCRPESVHNS